MTNAATGLPVRDRSFKGVKQQTTISLRGEAFFPSPSGFERISAAGAQHYDLAMPATYVAARLGNSDRLLSAAAGNTIGAPPPLLRVVDAASGKVLQTMSLEAGTHFVFDVKFSPDGKWCAITYTGKTGPAYIAVFRFTGLLTKAAIITLKLCPEMIAFDRAGTTIALLYDHEHDRVYGRRIALFRFPVQSPGGGKT